MIQCVPDHLRLFQGFLIMPFKIFAVEASIYLRQRPWFVASQSVDYRSGGKRQSRFLPYQTAARPSSSVRKWMPTNRMPRFAPARHECVQCRSLPSSGRFGGPARTTPCRFPSGPCQRIQKFFTTILRRSCSLISGKLQFRVAMHNFCASFHKT